MCRGAVRTCRTNIGQDGPDGPDGPCGPCQWEEEKGLRRQGRRDGRGKDWSAPMLGGVPTVSQPVSRILAQLRCCGRWLCDGGGGYWDMFFFFTGGTEVQATVCCVCACFPHRQRGPMSLCLLRIPSLCCPSCHPASGALWSPLTPQQDSRRPMNPAAPRPSKKPVQAAPAHVWTSR